MKQIVGYLLLVSISFLSGCEKATVEPPPVAVGIKTFYADINGTDLLNPASANGYKVENLKVTSKIEVNGIISDMTFYNNFPLDIYIEDQTLKRYIVMAIPTNYKQNPIVTYVQLAPNVIDTVTATYANPNFANIPDQIFYNRKLVFDLTNFPGGSFPSVNIVK